MPRECHPKPRRQTGFLSPLSLASCEIHAFRNQHQGHFNRNNCHDSRIMPSVRLRTESLIRPFANTTILSLPAFHHYRSPKQCSPVQVGNGKAYLIFISSSVCSQLSQQWCEERTSVPSEAKA